MRILRCDRGAAAIEFALVVLPVLFFILGIMQTGYIVWADNLLQTAVNTAARCGAIGSTTTPCSGSGVDNMTTTANLVFSPLSGATFSLRSCGGAGLTGTYNITIVAVVDLTITAISCYPTIPPPPS